MEAQYFIKHRDSKHLKGEIFTFNFCSNTEPLPMQHLWELLYGVVFRFRTKLPQSPIGEDAQLKKKRQDYVDRKTRAKSYDITE